MRLMLLTIWILLAGCAGITHRATTLEIDFSTGCHLNAKGVTYEQAQSLTEAWRFTDCEITAEGEHQEDPTLRSQ